MARLPRLFVPNLPQLILQRGAEGRVIAPDAQALDTLETILSEAVRRHGVALHAYVLMPNHFHLLASAPEPGSLSRALQSLGRRYVQYFNRRSARAGSLWEGRYRASLIQPETYLLVCSRYAELNPVRHALVSEASQYPWSSFRHHAGIEPSAFITDHKVYWDLGNTPFERQAVYRKEAEGVLAPEELRAIRAATLGGWGLGDSAFLSRIAAQTQRRTQPLARGRPVRPAPSVD